MSIRGSTSDRFALVKVAKQRPSHFYSSAVELGTHVMPTSPDYFVIHNHAILRSIQEIIKMHAWFYVNCVGY